MPPLMDLDASPMKTARPKPKAKSVKRVTTAERARIDALFSRFEALEPSPSTELNYKNPYTLATAVALSAQATDKGVNKATGPLFAIADTPEAMLALGEARLAEMIKTIGLYRTKARNVMATARILVEQYGGRLPLNREALQSLPGIGRKTASVVLNELGIEPAIAVDTHVFRVAHRLKLSSASTPESVERELMAKIAPQWRTRAHHWLILHGRYVCVARRPKCEICRVADLCPSRAIYLGV